LARVGLRGRWQQVFGSLKENHLPAERPYNVQRLLTRAKYQQTATALAVKIRRGNRLFVSQGLLSDKAIFL
jgi:hypothetical protein